MLIFYFLDTDFSTGARHERPPINPRHRKFKLLDATKSDIDSRCVFRLGRNMVDMHLRSAIPPANAAANAPARMDDAAELAAAAKTIAAIFISVYG